MSPVTTELHRNTGIWATCWQQSPVSPPRALACPELLLTAHCSHPGPGHYMGQVLPGDYMGQVLPGDYMGQVLPGHYMGQVLPGDYMGPGAAW